MNKLDNVNEKIWHVKTDIQENEDNLCFYENKADIDNTKKIHEWLVLLINNITSDLKLIKYNNFLFRIDENINEKEISNLSDITDDIHSLSNPYIKSIFSKLLKNIEHIIDLKSTYVLLEKWKEKLSIKSDIEKTLEKIEYKLSIVDSSIKSIEFNNNTFLSNELIKHSPLVEFYWNPEKWWAVEKVSENVEKLTWYNSKAFYDKDLNFEDLIHIDDIDRIRNEVVEYTINLWLEEYEQYYRIVCKDGEIKYIYDKTLVKYNGNNEITALYWFIYDISNQYVTDNNILNEKSLINDLNTKWNKNLILFNISNFNSILWLIWRDISNDVISEAILKIKEIFSWYKWSIYQISKTEFAFYQSPENYRYINKKPEIILTNIHKELNNIDVIVEGIIPIHLNFDVWGSFFDEDPLKNSYIALDKSKQTNNPEVFNISDSIIEKENIKNFLIWMSKIKNAINNNGEWFKVFLQEIKDNRNGSKKKYEALIRYEEENGDIISPYHFLEHINNSWLSSNILKIVIDKVIEFKLLNKDSSISININLSDIVNKDNIEYLNNAIESNWIDKWDIILEILEDSCLDEDMIETIIDIKSMWYKLAIDDFWVWCSNFERIIKIKPDYIKIDWSFIKNINTSKESLAIVSNTMNLAHVIGAEVIAEFVENWEIQKTINALWIEFSQWYHFSKPQNIDDIK